MLLQDGLEVFEGVGDCAIAAGVVVAREEGLLDAFEEVDRDPGLVLSGDGGTLESTIARKMKPSLQKVRNW